MLCKPKCRVHFLRLLFISLAYYYWIILPTIHTQADAPQYYLDAHNSAVVTAVIVPITLIHKSPPTPEPVLEPSPAQPPNFDLVPTADLVPVTPIPYISINNSPPIHKPVLTPSPAQPPNFDFVTPSNYTEDRRKAIGLVAGLIAVASALILLGLVFVWFILRWKRKQKETTYPMFDVSFGNEFENGTGPRKFSYRELASATNNFCEEAKLGEGGFGGVYKGFQKDLNTFVAVKRISKSSKQGTKEYTTEVKIISQLRHRNTVKLIGWCHEKDLILVYEFMPNGSLDSYLFKGKSLLTWDVSLVPWVWESYGNKRLVDVVDKKLGTNFDIKKMECLMIVGLWCAHPARNLRPSIRQAIQGLNFELPLPNLPSKMPVPNYDVPSSSTPAPAPTAMSGDSSLSLTVPR
ncbi:hypothetical protein EZV62_004325 [Acer yangbiense]|uniref:Protein kinase domain-containing protein n=1 Tax=Acer yangbiense TaxID=1000413 RepID=A0A5C7IJJ1_9ROSI|nr:hypothetical protein EZV62_004325 [Acer yangbiense]